MMKVSCIRAGVKDIPSSLLLTKASLIEQQMTGNAHFPSPTPGIASITAARQALEVALQKAWDGGKIAVDSRWRCHAELERLLVQLSKYVMSAAQGDSGKQLSSGFELRKAPVRIGALESPALIWNDRKLCHGTVHLKWSGVHGARSYQLFMNPDGPQNESAWRVVSQCTRRSATMRSEEPYRRYWFAVRAVGAAGASPLSNAVTGWAA